ncbi:hypothetical protein [uncultured Psychroserpens sp.]|uniref:hypothetical protein n=1 Tax=uncultured Psychroserpens sp. TaxID=255436 RepID=UPI0026060597|nr:hypothetical protein [uncultured Psychroserpens sp.]
MKDKIEATLEYYNVKEEQILKAVNSGKPLTTDEIISYGQQMTEIVHKITALEVAKEN